MISIVNELKYCRVWVHVSWPNFVLIPSSMHHPHTHTFFWSRPTHFPCWHYCLQGLMFSLQNVTYPVMYNLSLPYVVEVYYDTFQGTFLKQGPSQFCAPALNLNILVYEESLLSSLGYGQWMCLTTRASSLCSVSNILKVSTEKKDWCSGTETRSVVFTVHISFINGV